MCSDHSNMLILSFANCFALISSEKKNQMYPNVETLNVPIKKREGKKNNNLFWQGHLGIISWHLSTVVRNK